MKIAILCLLLILGLSAPFGLVADDRPNILLVMTDFQDLCATRVATDWKSVVPQI